MKDVILAIGVLYFLIGTFFLVMFMTGRLRLEMQSKKTGKWLEDVDIFILSYCLWWPLLVIMLLFGRRKDDEQ